MYVCMFPAHRVVDVRGHAIGQVDVAGGGLKGGGVTVHELCHSVQSDQTILGQGGGKGGRRGKEREGEWREERERGKREGEEREEEER